MSEILPRLLLQLVSAERQRGGFLVVFEDVRAALDAVGEDGENQWGKWVIFLDAGGYFAKTKPATGAKRVLTAKAHEKASQA